MLSTIWYWVFLRFCYKCVGYLLARCEHRASISVSFLEYLLMIYWSNMCFEMATLTDLLEV